MPPPDLAEALPDLPGLSLRQSGLVEDLPNRSDLSPSDSHPRRAGINALRLAIQNFHGAHFITPLVNGNWKGTSSLFLSVCSLLVRLGTGSGHLAEDHLNVPRHRSNDRLLPLMVREGPQLISDVFQLGVGIGGIIRRDHVLRLEKEFIQPMSRRVRHPLDDLLAFLLLLSGFIPKDRRENREMFGENLITPVQIGICLDCGD